MPRRSRVGPHHLSLLSSISRTNTGEALFYLAGLGWVHELSENTCQEPEVALQRQAQRGWQGLKQCLRTEHPLEELLGAGHIAVSGLHGVTYRAGKCIVKAFRPSRTATWRATAYSKAGGKSNRGCRCLFLRKAGKRRHKLLSIPSEPRLLVNVLQNIRNTIRVNFSAGARLAGCRA